MLEELLKGEELFGEELDGLDGLGETWPVIQWVNDPKSFVQRPESKRGGFIMTADHMELAGDIPKGAEANVIEFGANEENPDGSEVECVYTQTLRFVPLGKRSAWFAGRARLPRDFDWNEIERTYGDKPSSKLQIHALVQGESGLFLARVTFSRTVSKDALMALRAHNRNVQVALKKAGLRNKALRVNGWRWFWTAFAADVPKMRGPAGSQSRVTPVVIAETGDYIGSELRAQYFDVDMIRAFEDMWKKEPEVIAEAVPVTPPVPDYPPEDDTLYDDAIPF